MATGTVDIEFVTKLEQAVREINSIPGITKSAAEQAAKSWIAAEQRKTKELENQIKKRRKEEEEASKGALGRLAAEAGNLAKLGGLIGGPLGGALQTVGDSSEIAEKGFSKLSLGIGAAAVAAGVFVAAVGSVVTNLDDYRETIDDLVTRDVITPEQKESILEANAAIDVIKNNMSELSVVMAASVTPAIMSFTKGFIYASAFVQEFASDISWFVTGLSQLVTGGFSAEAVKQFKESLSQAGSLSESFYEAQKNAVVGVAQFQQDVDDAQAQKTAEFLDKQRKDTKKSTDERAKFAEQWADMVNSATESVMEKDDLLAKRQAEQILEYQELSEKAGKSEEERAAGLAALLQAHAKETYDYRKELADKEAAEQERLDAAAAASARELAAERAKVADILGSVHDRLVAAQRSRMDEEAAMEAVHNEQRLDLVEKLKMAKATAAEEEAALADLALTQQIERDEQSEELTKKKHEREIAAVQDVLSITSNVMGSLSDLSNLLFENRTKNMNKESSEYKKQAKKQFAIQKGMSIAMATINTAAAIINALATAPTIIAGAALAIAAGVTGAVQIGIIAAQQPKFHTGGLVGSSSLQPDEMSVTAQKGEGFLTRAGVASVGGEAGIDRLNSGAPISSQPTMAIINIDGRTVDSLWSAGRKGRNGLQARVEDQIRGQGLKGRSATRGR